MRDLTKRVPRANAARERARLMTLDAKEAEIRGAAERQSCEVAACHCGSVLFTFWQSPATREVRCASCGAIPVGMLGMRE